MTDVFSTPTEYANDLQASDLHSSLAERLSAQAGDALDPQNSLSGAWLFRRARELSAGGADLNPGTGGEAELFMDPAALQQRQSEIDARRAAIPDVSMADAKTRVKQEGLEGHVTLPSQDSMKAPVLDLMMSEAHERRDREAAIARGPQGFIPGALGLVTSLGVGMIDPVNAAAFSIPVLGEARWGKLLYSAGDSMLARGGVRALQGAAQGAVGTAALQPADWWLHTRDGQDYTMTDALKSVAMGAGMGAVAHAGLGAIGDIGARRRGMALPGSPQDLLERGLMTGRHVPGEALGEEGITADQLAGLGGAPAPVHPAEVFADLPPAAREDALHAAAADVIADRPVRSAEMLDMAADHDPRIAESFEAFHGSPHDFERFSTEGIGTGEGAQAFGHGLYFAENEKVAKGYQRTTSDRAFVDKVAQLYDEGFSPDDAWNEIKDNWSDFSPGEQRLMTALEKDQWLGFDYPHQAVNAALRSLKSYDASPETIAAARAIGNIYRVKINANHEHFLDWDKPLSEQTPHVQKALEKAGINLKPTWSVDEGGGRTDHMLMAGGEGIGRVVASDGDFLPYAGRSGSGEGTSGAATKTLAGAKKWVEDHAPEPRGLGEDIVRHLERSENPQQAAEKLQEAGIPGIKYLDQGSRGVPAVNGRVRARGDGKFDIVDDFGVQAGPFDTKAEADQYLNPDKNLTRNFVVFNDKHIEITHKNGEAVKLPERKPAPVADKDLVKAPKARGRAAADPETWSLNEFLASKGGLKPDPELAAIYGNKRGPFVPSFGPLIRKGGMTLDEALSQAKQHGYMLDPHDIENGTVGTSGRTSHGLTPNDLLDHLDAENRGQKVYKQGHLQATRYDAEQEKHVILGALEQHLEAAGEDVSAIDPKLLDRTVEIVHREGVSDVLDAYERAIMEDEERYNAIADARRSDPDTADIPGFDDGGTALGNGGRDQVGGGQAGRPEQGRGRPNDTQPSSNGARAARAADDPRWRQLADAPAAYDDPQALSESRAADTEPEPASVQPEKSLSAIEKAAADVEEAWRKSELAFTEEERQSVNEALDKIASDAKAREQIITEGAMCLAGRAIEEAA